MVFVGALVRRLEDYAASRDEYPTFESFYARLLGAFAEEPGSGR